MKRMLLVFGLGLAACNNGHWQQTIRQAPSGAFREHRGYVIAPVTLDPNVLVGDAPLREENRVEVREGVEMLSARFVESANRCGRRLGIGDTGPQSFTVRATLARVGVVTFTNGSQAHRLAVEILSPSGETLDHVVFYDPSGEYSIRDRLAYVGTLYGRQLCAYLNERSAP